SRPLAELAVVRLQRFRGHRIPERVLRGRDGLGSFFVYAHLCPRARASPPATSLLPCPSRRRTPYVPATLIAAVGICRSTRRRRDRPRTVDPRRCRRSSL